MLTLNNIFTEITLLLIVSTFVGALFLFFKQPLIIAFISVGIIVGPAGLQLISASEEIELFAELGIAILLFVVGLKLDINEIKAVGHVAILSGFGQIFLTGVIGYLLALLFRFEAIPAFYIAISLTFSSTIIIVKLLSDKKEIDALHSRIAVGILIIQDIVVILLMIALSAWASGSENTSWLTTALLIITKAIGFLLVIALVTRYLLTKILNHLAKSVELLVLFAITWAIALAALASALDFSREVGAFLAGVSLASTHYRAILGARLMSLRDFLLLFFFIDLGIHIDIQHLSAEIIPALVFSVFVLVGKPLIIISLVGFMGYRRYTTLITSLSLSQISEFSLLLATLGLNLGHITPNVVGLITLVALITMGISTYLIMDSHNIYQKLAPYLDIFERQIDHSTEESLGDLSELNDGKIDVIVFGLGRYGGSLIEYLCEENLVVLGVDFNPQVVKWWRAKGFHTVYGDAEEPEFTNMLPLDRTSWVVSTIPREDLSLSLLHSLEEHNFTGKVALTTHIEDRKHLLIQKNADLVLLPFQDAAKTAALEIKSLILR